MDAKERTDMRNQRWKEQQQYDLYYESSAIKCKAELGTIEKDATGLFGKFEPCNFLGEKILGMFIKEKFDTVLDIGAGGLEATDQFIKNGKIVDICDFEDTSRTNKDITIDEKKINEKHIGDFFEIEFNKLYDAVWCSHVLEHMLNPNIFLKKIHSLIKEEGFLCIVVPPRKPQIVGGHVSLWNGGLLLYHLVHAGFDCSDAIIHQYDYNIGIIVKKRSIVLPKLNYDIGDIKKLKDFFPRELPTETDSFNGDILNLNI